MPTTMIAPRSEQLHAKGLEEAQFAELREALQRGWDDIEAGRYVTLEPNEIGAFVRAIGQRAAERVRLQRMSDAKA